VDQQRAQINITSFADAEQLHTPTRAALSRHQTQIRRELTPRSEGPRIIDRRYCSGGRQQSNAGDGSDTLALALLALPGGDLPLDIRGTEFQRRVWRELREIPSGTTTSYTEIARRIGAPKALRAVAGACAANVLAIAIPCHRVLRSNGSLSGYRWGMERKRQLIEREQGHRD